MYCKNCNVNVETDYPICPLCGAPLEGEVGVSTFPQKSKEYKKPRPVTATGVYVSILLPIIIMCAVINALVAPKYLWSVFALIVALYGYYSLKTTIFYKGPDGAKIFSQTLMVSVLCITAQYIFKTSEWVFAYAMPVFILVAMVLHIILIIAFKNNRGKRFFRYMWLTNILGLVPMILTLAGVCSKPILPTVTSVICCFSLLLQVLIMGKDILEEIKKKSHI